MHFYHRGEDRYLVAEFARAGFSESTGFPPGAGLPNLHAMPTRRAFLHLAAAAGASAFAQAPGERPTRAGGVEVINPRGRVPVGLIIDDSTCLVNLNRFAMPQFDQAFRGENPAYHKPWREWPVEIPERRIAPA